MWKSTSASGAPDNSSLSHFSAMTRPTWLGRAARNRHRHAIEQASRRWRGGRRDDSARTRRKILISTQVDVTAVRDRWLPTAVAFRRLWEITTGRTSLYVWTPVAPEGFQAIGLGVSTTPEAPALDSVRCLPNAWVVPASAKPRLLFDNVGMQSRKPGGLWRIGSMGLLALGRDRDPPELALDLNPAFTSVSPDAAAPPLPPRNMPVAYAHAAPASAAGTLPVATAF